MGFSLKKKLEEGIAQINPFDHGATAATVRAQPAAAPAPASTIRTANRAGYQQASPVSQPNIFQRAAHTFSDVGHDLTHNAVTDTVGDIAKELPESTVKTFAPLARSVVGTGQAASGLYDLATPGTGTNRVSDALDWEAKQLDQAPRVSDAYYHGGQAVGDAAQFAFGAGEAKAAVTAATKIPKIAPIVKPLTRVAPAIENGVTRAVAPVAEKGFVGRVAARTAVNATKPAYVAGNAAFAATQAGKDASTGKDVSPAGVAENLAVGGVGMPAAGAVLHEAAAPLVQKGVSALRDAKLLAPSSLNGDELHALKTLNQQARTGAITEDGVYDRGVAAAQKAGIDYRSPEQIDNLIYAHGQFDRAQQMRKAAIKRAQDTIHNFAVDHPIGLTSGAVNDEGERIGMNGKPLKRPTTGPLAPHEAFQQEYADALQQMESGMTGGQMVPDGNGGYVRTSEHTPFYRQHYAAAGKAPTKADWLAEAKRQLETGKADPYAQDHYESLKTPAADAPANPQTALERSDASQPMTPLSDALAAKEKKLIRNVKSGKAPAGRTPQQDSGVDMPIPGDMPTNNIGPEKRTRFTSKTVQNSDQVSDPVKAQTDASYTSDTMKNAAQRTEDYINEHGQDKALEDTLSELNTRRGTASRDTLDRAIELAARHDELGTEKGNAIAAQLYNLVGEHGSASGQQSQILARIARRSPAGLRNKALNDLKEWGVDLNTTKGKAIQDEIQSHIDAIKSLPDGPEKDWAIAVLQKSILKHKPQGIADKAISLWKAGLLSGVKTHGGNVISNATFGGLKKISDVPATFADQIMSVGTGVRTKTNTKAGLLTGTATGFKQGAKTLKTGIDARQVGDKYEQRAELNLGNKYLQATIGRAANGVFRVLGAADQPTYYAALKNSLYDQAKADGLNKGKHGMDLIQHMNDMVKNPTEKMVETAEKEANKSVLAYETIGSKAIRGVHDGIDKMPGASDTGKSIAHAVVNVLAPFVRVPSAFISRTVDFTPFGVGKEIFSQVAHKQFDQRALSQAIGEGITGTGVVALGIALSQQKLLSGDYPKNNPKEAARWKAEGITPNSVKLGNTWVSLNYLGPVGLLFNAGNKIENAKGESATTKAGEALAGLGQGLMGQSFLQGFSGFSDAIQDPERNAKSFINSEASSIVPSLSNDVANASDDWQRQSNTVGQAVKNRIPGLRETNPVKTDVYGNDLRQPTTGINPINPLRPSDQRTGPVLDEVSRLHNVDPNNADLQVTPMPVERSITVDKKKVSLNDQQRSDLQKAVGQVTQKAWGQAIKSGLYQSLDDAGKAKMLNNIRTDAATLAQRQYVVDNNLGTYSKAVTNRQAGLASGQMDLSAYVSGSDGGSKSYIKDDPAGTQLLAHIASMSTDQQKDWASKPLDQKYQALYERSKGIVPAGLPDLPQNNATLKAYADYLKVKNAKTAPTPMELNKAKKTFLKDSYGSDLSTSSKDLLGSYSVGEKMSAIDNGDVSKDDVTKAIEYDNFLINSGLASSPKISNKIRRAYGYDDAPDSGGKSSGSKKGKGKANKLTYDLFSKGLDPVSYNRKLRDLVKAATLK